MTSALDDLDAVRAVVEALDPFGPSDRQRIIRWACEKLDVAWRPDSAKPLGSAPEETGDDLETPAVNEAGRLPQRTQDLRSFVQEKRPESNNEFATCVAYYYRFVAPADQQKDAIDGEDIQTACRLAGRARLQKPGQTLVNAAQSGFLDKSGERGEYRINTVGENLVAMSLPSESSSTRAKSQGARKSAAKRASKRAGSNSASKTKTPKKGK